MSFKELINEEKFISIIESTINVKPIVGQLLIDLYDNDFLVDIINYKGKDCEISSILDNIKEESKQDTDINKKTNIFIPKSVDLTYVTTVIENVKPSQSKVLIVNGFEVLLKDDGEAKHQRKYEDIIISAKLNKDLRWDDLIQNAGKLFEAASNKYEKVIIIISTIDEESFDNIQVEFSKIDLDIQLAFFKMPGDNEESITYQKEVIEQLQTKSMSEITKMIEDGLMEGVLSRFSANYLTAHAYLQKGFLSGAIKLFLEIYDELDYSNKLLLSDMLIRNEEYKKAEEILRELHSINPYHKRLYSNFIKINNEKKSILNIDCLIEEGMELFPNYDYLIQEAANYFNTQEKYEKVALAWRKLSTLHNSVYYELLARIADLLNNLPQNKKVAEDYIEALILEHPEIRDEAKYRLGLLLNDYYMSWYRAYSCFSESKLPIYSKESLNMIYRILNIMEDYQKVSAALGKRKPFKKAEDAERIARQRTFELLRAILALTEDKLGYQRWRTYINNTQNKDTWLIYLLKELTIKSDYWLEHQCTIEGSKLYNEFHSDSEGKTLFSNKTDITSYIRKIRTNTHFTEDTLDQVIQDYLKYTETNFNGLLRYWARYEASLSYSYFGMSQNANNHALSLLELSMVEEDMELKNYAKAMGLIAWGNAQYRIGNNAEGIACTLVGIDLAITINELVLISDATQVIFKIVNENRELLHELDVKKIGEFTNQISIQVNPEDIKVKIQTLVLQKDWKSLYTMLKTVMYDDFSNSDKLVDFVNFINACVGLGKNEEAFNTIISNIDNILPLLNYRKDMKSEILFVWSKIIFNYSIDKELWNQHKHLVESLLEASIGNLEERRNDLYHKTDRASLTTKIQNIVRFLLDVKATRIQDVSSGEIFLLLDYLVPRTLIESRTEYGEITPELSKVETEYKKLYEELIRIQPENKDKYAELSLKFLKLQGYLKEHHPHYRPLTTYKKTDIQTVQNSIQEETVFYQYVQTVYGVLTVIVDINKVTINWENVILTDVNNLEDELGSLLTKEPLIEKDIIRINEINEELSKVYYGSLISYLDKYPTKKVIVCPDFNNTFFTPTLVRWSNTWLIEEVGSIFNVVNINEIINSERQVVESSDFKIVFGKPDNNFDALTTVKKSMEEDFPNNICSFEDLKLMEDPVKVIIFFAHGIPDPLVKGNGAITIQGEGKESLWGDELKDLTKKAEYIILITCRSGTPSGQIEGDSIFSSMLSTDAKFILCKWDVVTKSAKVIIEDLIKNNFQEIPQILNQSRTELIQSEFKHPGNWAAFEHWGRPNI
ncbi:tetratricopeptide repeat protein [Guptibacillus spartinae]|uniref:tetratricopeptide repeat protein n=1 Tax=Guptibacillus spartinae TaxID=3025679 RepID=UPI00235E7CFD|nr:hypothetical protein [Pseudalkalibacillus spartinae]